MDGVAPSRFPNNKFRRIDKGERVIAATPRQLEVLRWVAAHIRAAGYAPTLREIGDALGMVSTNGVKDCLRALEKKGLLTCGEKKARTLVLTPEGLAAAERAWRPHLVASPQGDADDDRDPKNVRAVRPAIRKPAGARAPLRRKPAVL